MQSVSLDISFINPLFGRITKLWPYLHAKSDLYLTFFLFIQLQHFSMMAAITGRNMLCERDE